MKGVFYILTGDIMISVRSLQRIGGYVVDLIKKKINNKNTSSEDTRGNLMNKSLVFKNYATKIWV